MNQSRQTTGFGPAPSSGTEAEEAAPAAASGLEQEEAAPAVAAGSAVAAGPAPAGLDMEEEEAVPAVLLDLTNKKEEAGPAVAAAAGRSANQAALACSTVILCATHSADVFGSQEGRKPRLLKISAAGAAGPEKEAAAPAGASTVVSEDESSSEPRKAIALSRADWLKLWF